MRAAAIAISVLLPTLGIAQDINPFKPGANARPAASVFAPAPAPRALIPPPLPKAEKHSTPAAELPVAKTVAATPASPTCRIEVSPRAPLIGAQGGEFKLRVEEGARNQGCVAGIEARESWLKIRHFNGRELTLYAEPNKGAAARHSELFFANAVDSLILKIVQASP